MPNHPLDPSDVELGARPPSTGPRPEDYLRFGLGALRRRRGLAAGVFLGGFALLLVVYLLAPPRYHAEARILAQRQQSLPAIVRSSVTEDQPTRAAWEIIHRRDNLVELARQAGLLEAPARAEPLDRLRQAAARATASLSAEEDPLEALVLRLDKRLKVEAGEVTIAIELDWPDPQQAYRIVEGALQNFLEARHVQEVTALDETIAILRGRASVLRVELDQATEETRRTVLQEALRAPRPSLAAAAAAPPPHPGASEEVVRLRSMLEAKERAIGDVEEFRRRRLAELQAQYESRRTVFAEAHPEMVSLRQDIVGLTHDSSQITALRAEEQRLRREYQALLVREPAPPQAAPAAAEPAARPAPEGISAAVERSERVRDARSRYQEVMESVNRAQLDLDTARSAFKHRYQVIWPVRVPRRPVSPNPLVVFGLGGLAVLLAALLAPAVLDWRSGRVLERWQVERELDLPIIGRVHAER